MNEWDEVEDVRFNLDLLETIEERTETFLIAGASIGVFILLVAIILVFNTIRLTIYAKRDLIRAMKLVGATNAFIRRPFLVEDRKSTRLNSSHVAISYAVFCLKKKIDRG